MRGPVYVAFNTSNPLPGLLVMLPGAGRACGWTAWSSRSSRGPATRSPRIPDLPVRSFTLAFEGGRPDAALVLTQDLCAEGSDLTMSVKLVAYNGKESAFEQELATPGCDPRAKVSVRRRGKLATLVARVTAARGGPGVTGITVKLPKSLRRGKPGAIVVVGGRRLQPLRTGKRRVTIPFAGDGVRSAKVVWKGLRHQPQAQANDPHPPEPQGRPRPHDDAEQARPSAREAPEAAAASSYPRPPVGGSSNGKTPASGAGYRGSSPCPPVAASNICSNGAARDRLRVVFLRDDRARAHLRCARTGPEFLRPDSKFRKMYGKFGQRPD